VTGQAFVRTGGVDDAMRLRAIRLEALADTPEAYGSSYAEESAWDDAKWREVAGRWTFFLAEDDDEAVGMASGGHRDDYPGTWWLFGMYVTPRLRGTGVAEQLVGSVAQWARSEGAGELHLAVTEPVARARAFYAKMGYLPTGDVELLHRNPTVRLINLVRRLD
jgi:GNAT superfamily N-acetyltransferase